MSGGEGARGSPLVLSFAADPADGRVLDAGELREIITEVSRKPSVAELTLKGNRFSPSSLVLLCTYLSASARISRLDLSCCDLGDRGAAEVVRAICAGPSRGRAGTYIKQLDLSLNNITPDGAARMGLLMAQSPHCPLRDLTVKFNPIKATGVFALCRMQVPLRVLDCRYCALDVAPGSAGFATLLQAVRESRAMTELFVGGNGLTIQQGDQIVESLKLASHTRLTSDTIYFGPEVGELPSLAAYLTATPLKRNDAYSLTVLADIAKLDGQVAVVRGRWRGVANSDLLSPSLRSSSAATVDSNQQRGRSRSVQRVVPLEIRPPATSSRSASIASRAASQQSRATSLGRGHADPCVFDIVDAPKLLPRKREATNADPAVGDSPAPKHQDTQSAAPDGAGDALVIPEAPPLSAPPAPTIVLSAITRESRARSRAALHDLLEKERPKVGPHSGLLLTKGQTARMLLDRCVVSDEQCTAILNLPSTYELQAGRGARLGLPVALQAANATPSFLNSLPLSSAQRIDGIAKLLYCVLNAPGDRVPLETVREMPDLPESLRQAATPTAVANYRSHRTHEDREARSRVQKLMDAAKSSGRSRSRSAGALKRQSSRYLDFYRNNSGVNLTGNTSM